MLATEVAFSTIKGLIGIGEVGSCVAMVAARIIDAVRGMGAEDGVLRIACVGVSSC